MTLIDAIRQRLASLNFKAPAASTLKTEIRTFLRTYADSLNYRRGEDHDLGVVLPRLSLITQIGSEEEHNFDEDTYALLRSGDVPSCVLAYAILDYMRNQSPTEILIPELFYSGAIPFQNVFPGSENDLFSTIEILGEEHPHVFAIRKAGSDMFLYILDRPTSILEVLSY